MADPRPTPVPVFEDERGRLTLIRLAELPFAAARAYVLSAIPAGAHRGGHASRSQSRVMVCVSGRARVTLDDGHSSGTLELVPPLSVQVPAGTWHQIEALDEHLTILVLAEGEFDRSDYAERSELPLTAAHTART